MRPAIERWPRRSARSSRTLSSAAGWPPTTSWRAPPGPRRSSRASRRAARWWSCSRRGPTPRRRSLREVDRADAHKLPLVTFRIEDCRPTRAMEYFLSAQHWLDAFPEPGESHLTALADAVRRVATAEDDREARGCAGSSRGRRGGRRGGGNQPRPPSARPRRRRGCPAVVSTSCGERRSDRRDQRGARTP